MDKATFVGKSVADAISAAKEGNCVAQTIVGHLYAKEKDYKLAYRWYSKSAKQGYAEAQYNLGLMHSKAQGVQKDYQKALEQYTKAAKQDHAASAYKLGVMYIEGHGVLRDATRAFDWFAKAAAQGHKEAQCKLGLMYADGKNVPLDIAQALGWLTKAATQGHKEAQFRLGLIYDNGTGVIPDYAMAKQWYDLAAQQGHIEAHSHSRIWWGHNEKDGWIILDWARNRSSATSDLVFLRCSDRSYISVPISSWKYPDYVSLDRHIESLEKDPIKRESIAKSIKAKFVEISLLEERRRRHFQRMEMAPPNMRPRALWAGKRNAYCWNCKHRISSEDLWECVHCGWIVCSCGACGCGRDMKFSQDIDRKINENNEYNFSEELYGEEKAKNDEILEEIYGYQDELEKSNEEAWFYSDDEDVLAISCPEELDSASSEKGHLELITDRSELLPKLSPEKPVFFVPSEKDHADVIADWSNKNLGTDLSGKDVKTIETTATIIGGLVSILSFFS